ncbi:hypothetical protein ACIRVF_16270 [Kitasatospora sp. NPDC101157]|uniref:hypothetical protein n=1 Tax=Kitasatospora sp. NPDC101157 TaxID=3364098 RepID=UPI0038008F72
MPEPGLSDAAARERYRMALAHDTASRRARAGSHAAGDCRPVMAGERTVAGHIARLRELYEAEALFQPGRQVRGARAGEPGG